MNEHDERDARISNLVKLSTAVYTAFTPTPADTEPPARRLLRQSMQIVAHELAQSQSMQAAGALYYAYLHRELESLGVPAHLYDAWVIPLLQNADKNANTILLPDIDLLAQNYADIARGTRTVDGELESNAVHVLHVTALLIPYAATVYPELDINTLSLYALLHDAVEAYAGDTVTIYTDAALEQAKHEKEAAALHKISKDLENNYPLFVQLIKDYEQLADQEAKCTKVFDKLDPSFSHALNNGIALKHDHGVDSAEELRYTTTQTTKRMRAYSGSFDELMQDREALIEYSIRAIDWK